MLVLYVIHTLNAGQECSCVKCKKLFWAVQVEKAGKKTKADISKPDKSIEQVKLLILGMLI